MVEKRLRALTGKRESDVELRENVNFSGIGDAVWRNASVVFFRRHAKIILSFAFIGLVCGIAYVLLAPAMYTANAQLLIEPKLPQFLRETSSEPNHVLDGSQLESHMVLLQSERVATMVIKKLGLLRDSEFQNQPDWLRRYFEKSPSSKSAASSLLSEDAGGKDPMRTAVERFEKRLKVRRIGISYAVQVSFSSIDPAKAAKIANATTDAYLQTLIDFRSEAARTASQWLEDRLAQLRVQMNEANVRAQKFKAAQDYRIVTPTGVPVPGTNGSGKTAPPGGGQVTLDELELTADTYRKVYQNFFSAFTEAVQRESYPVSNVQVISKAVVPDRKSSPKALLVTGLALVIGAFLGGFIALLRDVFSHRPVEPTPMAMT